MARLVITSPVQCGPLPLAEGVEVAVPDEISQVEAEEIVALGVGRWMDSAAGGEAATPARKKSAARKSDDGVQ